MVGQLMILNPGPKRRKAKKATKRRRKARAMTAKQLKYFGKRGGKKKRKARETVIVATSNPRRASSMAKRRRRKGTKSHKRRFNRNPTARKTTRRRRFRRNPVDINYMQDAVMTAGVGVAGALATGFILTKLPQSMFGNQKSMMTKLLIKVGVAFGVGLAGTMVAGEKVGRDLTGGALVVAIASAIQNSSQNGMFGQASQLGRYVSMKGIGNRRRRRTRMGAMRRRRRLNGFPNIGPRNMLTKPYAPTGLNRMTRRGTGLGYIGPGRALNRYVRNQ